MIHPDRIGHVVIKVRDLERSRRFYTEVLGLELMKELPEVKMIFLASNRRDHHELALAEIGQPPGVPGRTILGCRISRFGSRTSTTCAPIASSRSTTSRLASRSNVTRSVYFLDQDGYQLGLYVDNSPEEIAKMSDPYFGLEKLDFALEEPGMRDYF